MAAATAVRRKDVRRGVATVRRVLDSGAQRRDGALVGHTGAALGMLLLAAALAAAPARGADCRGDCNRDSVLSVDELIVGVQLALGLEPATSCPAWTAAGAVRIADLVAAVRAALGSCAPRLTATITPTATPTPPLPTQSARPTPDAVGRVFDAICAPGMPGRRVDVGGDSYHLHCETAGHWTDVALQGHAGEAEAAAAFAVAAEPGEPFAFHDLPAAYWEVPFYIPELGGADRFLVWRLGCWVVFVHSFDDTTYRLAPQVLPVSEALLADAGDALRERCAAPPGVDLVPAEIRASYSGGGGCGPFGVLSVCVTNAGTLAAPAFAVAVEPGMTVELPPLAAGAQGCASQSLPDVVSFFTVRVDPDDRVVERDETNNVLATHVQRPTVPATCSPTPPPVQSPPVTPSVTHMPSVTRTASGTRTRRSSATATETPTPSRTPSCAPTGTPYCADQCRPCPTVRLGCYRSACGRCFEKPHCVAGEVVVRDAGGPCGACATPTPSR